MGERFAKATFVLSLLLFAFLYGVGAQAFSWFPVPFLERAYDQAKAVAPLLDFGGYSPAFVEPRVYHDREGVTNFAPEKVQPGLTLIASVWEDFGWEPGLKLIDQEGRVLHQWRVDPAAIFSREDSSRRPLSLAADRSIHGSYLFENGDVLVNVDYVGTARLDACGRVLWRLREGNHHSIARADDGTFWIPGSSDEPRRALAGQPGRFENLQNPVYHDYLLRVSGDGKVLDRIDLLEVLATSGLARYVAKARRLDDEDVTHLNDIAPLGEALASEYPNFSAGDLAVSLRNLDLVFVMDPASRTVRWHASEPFIAQHDPDFMGRGWIGVFDNNKDGTDRGTVAGGSRIVALRPHADSVKVIFPTEQSEPFYTGAMGKWQSLGNGNLLLTESQAGRLVEVTPDGRTVWEWIHSPYDDSSVPEVSEGTRYSLNGAAVSQWPCSLDEPTEGIGSSQ